MLDGEEGTTELFHVRPVRPVFVVAEIPLPACRVHFGMTGPEVNSPHSGRVVRTPHRSAPIRCEAGAGVDYRANLAASPLS